MITIGGRPLSKIVGALLEPSHVRALYNMPTRYPQFGEALGRYLLGRGTYPARIQIRTPMGLITPTLYSRHDMLTVNEIFCREDYPADEKIRTVVDFGSNIGLSALYFLTQSRNAKVFLFEPLPQNIERLKDNCSGLLDRCVMSDAAVGTKDGEVRFGWEPTGRYGGIDLELGHSISVQCRNANKVIGEILAEREEIDILKIDVEGLEVTIIQHLSPHHLTRIRRIYAECKFDGQLQGFKKRQYGSVVQFSRSEARN